MVGNNARKWSDLKREVRGGARARVCAVAELFESEVLGDGAEAEEETTPVKTVKPKTGKAALILKSDRVSALFLIFGQNWGILGFDGMNRGCLVSEPPCHTMQCVDVIKCFGY